MATMDQAHNTALNDLIKEACDVGAVRITERQLLRCHPGAKSLSKAIWRDLQTRFDDEIELRNAADGNDNWRGYWMDMLRAYNGVTLVVRHPVNANNGDRWWIPVAEMAGMPLNNKV